MNAVTNNVAPKVQRKPKRYDLSAVFPEVEGLEGSSHRYMVGFDAAGPGVPTRKQYFLQEKEFMEALLIFVNCPDQWIMCLTGPTGCGKSERVVDFYARLLIPLLRKSAKKRLETWDLLGQRVIEPLLDEKGNVVGSHAVFVRGPLYKAMQYGYPFLLDEGFNVSPDVTSALHTLRDRGFVVIDETGETLQAAPGFKLFLTSNFSGFGDTTGFYSGGSPQNLAWLNGLVTVQCTYPSEAVEVKIAEAAFKKAHPAFDPSDPEMAAWPRRMVKIANRVRAQFVGDTTSGDTHGRLEVVISTRTLIMWVDWFVSLRTSTSKVHPFYRALDFVCLNQASPESRLVVDAIISEECEGIARYTA